MGFRRFGCNVGFEPTPTAATRQCSDQLSYIHSILQRIRTSILGFKGPCPAIRREEYINAEGRGVDPPWFPMHVRFQGGVTGRCRTFRYFVATPRIELEIKPYESSVIPFHHVAILERVIGIEPTSKHWKCLIITAIRYSRF
jgi:hypothetical protein